MGVGVNVPWHRGAGREAIDLDIHFLVGLAGEILDEDLLGLDLAGRFRLVLGDERDGGDARHHQGRDEGLPWGHGTLLCRRRCLALA
jgi:hypothetical protein